MRSRRTCVLGVAGALLLLCITGIWITNRLRYLNLPNYGTTIDQRGAPINVEAEQQFFAAYQRGEPGRWHHIVTTVEGDPVTQQVYYFGNGPTYQLINDARHDSYGSGRIERYTCQKLLMQNGRLAFDECTE